MILQAEEFITLAEQMLGSAPTANPSEPELE
jgi:hypothetical protein